MVNLREIAHIHTNPNLEIHVSYTSLKVMENYNYMILIKTEINNLPINDFTFSLI